MSFTTEKCRTCLKSGSSLFDLNLEFVDNINDERNSMKKHGVKNMLDLLKYLNFIENEEQSYYPTKICDLCVNRVLECFEFKNICHASMQQLKVLTLQNDLVLFTKLEEANQNVEKDHFFGTEVERASMDVGIPMNKISDLAEESNNNVPKTYCKKLCNIKLCSTSCHSHQKHKKDSIYLCSACGKSFSTRNSLSQHYKTHNLYPNFSCEYCDKEFKKKQSLNTHIRIQHSTNPYKFSCDVCDKEFTAMSSLKTHKQSHLGLNVFSCDLCGKVFKNQSYFKFHMKNSHLGVPLQYICPMENCGRSFSRKYSLKIHRLHSHINKRDFICELCAKCFLSVNNLRDHLETHKDNRLVCDICHLNFAKKRTLQKHQIKHFQ